MRISPVILFGGICNYPQIASQLDMLPSTAAEYLTTIYLEFNQTMVMETDSGGTRYRMIHWLTRLFDKHPDLLLELS
jgi:hypothetical protein